MAVSDVASDVSGPQTLGRRDWRADSVCRKHPTQWWFAGTHQNTVQAKAICSGCGVRASCLEFALSRPDLLGIWAATTPSDRASMRRGDRAPVCADEPVIAACALLDVDNGVDLERGAAACEVEVELEANPVVVSIDEPGKGTPASDSKGASRRGPRRGIGPDPVSTERADLLTPAEAARILGVTPNTVTRWSRAGKISAIQTIGGHRRFRRSEIERVQQEANLFLTAHVPA